jgi:hypothetical protein
MADINHLPFLRKRQIALVTDRLNSKSALVNQIHADNDLKTIEQYPLLP